MNCEKCGGELRQEENKLICTKCGAEFSIEGDVQAPSAEYVVPRGFSSKKNIIIIIVAALLMIGGVGAVVAVNVTKSNSQTVPSGLQIAERYLSEQNYEQAIIEFEKILEIEPMNVDAYLGLAEAYIGVGDKDKAIELLKKGLDITGDERIKAWIDELTNSSNSEALGSMGYVIIAGAQVDIATTESLFIYNKEGNLQFRESQFDVVIYLKNNLSEEDLSELSRLSNLKKLSINFAGISDISFLTKLTELSDLYLDCNEISDITPLASLTNLNVLNLSSNQISDITPLAGLTNLTDLDLYGNKISNITPLAGLRNITSLSLGDNQISDITLLAGYTNLTFLYLHNNQISDITPLAGLTNLTYLSLWNNKISNIMPLATLTNLIDLSLGDNSISDITPLKGLTNLTSLNLHCEQISDSDKEWLKTQLPNCEISW